MRSLSSHALVALSIALLAGACGSETTGPEGPWDLVFRGEAGFAGPHGGQPIEVALLDEDGEVLARREGVVSATGDPALELTFEAALFADRRYTLRYWIDSNIGGGTPGACDPPGVDHQWAADFTAGPWHVEWTAVYDTARMTSVCGTF